MKQVALPALTSLALGLGALAMATLVAGTSAHAAQPYWCVCKGEKKRFLASTRKCEHDYKVKSCSKRQFSAFNRAACRSNGCTAP